MVSISERPETLVRSPRPSYGSVARPLGLQIKDGVFLEYTSGLPALSTLPVPYRELESLENVFNLNSNPETVDFEIIWLDKVSTCVKTIRLTIRMVIEVKIATGDLYIP